MCWGDLLAGRSVFNGSCTGTTFAVTMMCIFKPQVCFNLKSGRFLKTDRGRVELAAWHVEAGDGLSVLTLL